MIRRSAFAVTAVALLAACGATPAPAPPDAARDDVAMATDAVVARDVPVAQDLPSTDTVVAEDVPAPLGPYPEGPYGNREGNVIANLAWQGYVNETGEEVSTALAFGDTDLQSLRGNGRGYALVQVSEFL